MGWIRNVVMIDLYSVLFAIMKDLEKKKHYRAYLNRDRTYEEEGHLEATANNFSIGGEASSVCGGKGCLLPALSWSNIEIASVKLQPRQKDDMDTGEGHDVNYSARTHLCTCTGMHN